MSKRKRSRLSRRLRLRRSKSRAGAVSDGTLQPSESALQQTKIEVFAFGPTEEVRQSIQTVDEIESLRSKFPQIWVNVVGLGDMVLIHKLGHLFGLHPLALEDVIHVHQRAKVEPYENSIYIVVREVERIEPFESDQVSIFLGKDFVVTFQERPGDDFDAIRRQLSQTESLLRKQCQPDYLVYRLVDAVIDGYFPALERVGDQLDDLDEKVSNHPSPSVFSTIHQLRGDLLLLRRAVWPHREAVNQLLRDPNPQISEHTRTYLRDVYDHTVQLIDIVETYRDVCTDLRDYYMSTISNRSNEIMKVLTIIATIFIPLSFVVGLWGMNFDPAASPWNMPELNWRYGYPMALAVMAGVAGGMIYFFRRRGWIGSGENRHTKENPGGDESHVVE